MVPCGQCTGCRLERSRQWAVRCMHEASLHDENCFVTLTYADEHLPLGGSLCKSDVQKFLKRLRQRLARSSGGKLRYYYCGEYGENGGRPHYHFCFFGFDFSDKYIWRKNRHGDLCFRSPVLESLWKLGQSEIGAVTFKSAAYVARYIMKKRLGKDAAAFYERVDADGIIHKLVPEYTDMSRRGGIGKVWFDSFRSDVFPDDFIVVDGKKARTPRYYDGLLEAVSPDEFRLAKRGRKRSSKRHSENNRPERLRVREMVLDARLSLLKRELE